MESTELRNWIRGRNLEAVTLGQLLTLMELVGAESVAEVGRAHGRAHGKAHNLSAGGVNARQKLRRLDDALKLGRKLLVRTGKFSRPTEAGTRVAGEFRIFLEGLRGLSAPNEETQTWVVAAGETWVQSLLMPAVISLAKRNPAWRWDVRNMRTGEIRSGLRDGILHFGFLRGEEVGPDLITKPGFRHDSFTIVAGAAARAPGTARELLRWLVKSGRPFAQQGSTWDPICSQLLKAAPSLAELGSLQIQISCQSHTQAAEAARTEGTWCIVPSVIGRAYANSCKTCEIKIPEDTMVVAYNLRALSKLVHYDKARDMLCDAIMQQAQMKNR